MGFTSVGSPTPSKLDDFKRVEKAFFGEGFEKPSAGEIKMDVRIR